MKHYEDRILFLKEFTKQIILNSLSGEEKPLKIEEKEELPSFMNLKAKEINEKTKPIITSFHPHIMPKIINPSLIYPKPRYRLNIKPILPDKFKQSIKLEEMPPIAKIQPAPEALPPDFNLGKIDFLIRDSRVTIIECQGPGKLITAKTLGQTTVTKISLTKEEIQEMINRFSEAARIPIISGLFKAAIGNLIMTAVISDLVGSRFIITKITPRFILEQQTGL